MLAVDTSILIYAHREETELHQPAASWLVTLAQGVQRWALPVFCVAEFVRVVTHDRVFSRPSTVADAARFIEALTDAPTCEVIQPGPEFLRQLFTTAHESEATGNLIFDAQIAALCTEHGVNEILTNDSDFWRFKTLRVLRLAGPRAPTETGPGMPRASAPRSRPCSSGSRPRSRRFRPWYLPLCGR